MKGNPFPYSCLRRFLLRRRRHEIVMLILMVLFTGGIWAFIELADEVMEGETRGIDERILLALRNPDDFSDPAGPRWFEEMCRDITSLGGSTIAVMLAAGVCGYLRLTSRSRTIPIVVLAVAGGILLSLLLKMVFDRPRPDLVPHEAYVYTKSFPSGHSIMAAATYLTLAALLAHVQEKTSAKVYLVSVAVILSLLVGFTRVYLGVHWPTDVLAGWTVGALWTLAILKYGHWLHHSPKGRDRG